MFSLFFFLKNHHFLVTSINGLIQGIASIIESSFFIVNLVALYIDKITTLKYQSKGCFSVSIKALTERLQASLFGFVHFYYRIGMVHAHHRSRRMHHT